MEVLFILDEPIGSQRIYSAWAIVAAAILISLSMLALEPLLDRPLSLNRVSIPRHDSAAQPPLPSSEVEERGPARR